MGRHRRRCGQCRVLRGAWPRRSRALACSCWSARRRTRTAATAGSPAGAIRFAYNGVEDIKAIMPDLTRRGNRQHRFRHLHRRPVLRRHVPRHAATAPTRSSCELLVTRSPSRRCSGCARRASGSCRSIGRQAFKIDGKFKFWGGLTVESWGGGPGLVDMETAIARKRGHRNPLQTRALMSLMYDGDAVTGVQSQA